MERNRNTEPYNATEDFIRLLVLKRVTCRKLTGADRAEPGWGPVKRKCYAVLR